MRIVLVMLLLLFLGGCTTLKSIILVNYRDRDYSVKVDEKTDTDAEGLSEPVKAKSSIILESAKVRSGDVYLVLTDSSGKMEKLTIDRNSPDVKVLNDTQMIVEIK